MVWRKTPTESPAAPQEWKLPNGLASCRCRRRTARAKDRRPDRRRQTNDITRCETGVRRCGIEARSHFGHSSHRDRLFVLRHEYLGLGFHRAQAFGKRHRLRFLTVNDKDFFEVAGQTIDV